MKTILQWFRFKRVCAWCKCYMGGNPFSKNVTHGICRGCKSNMEADILKYSPVPLTQFIGRMKRDNSKDIK